MTLWLVALIVFLAIFTQSLAGFGLAMVSMPLLAPVVGLSTAAPLVALVGLAAEVIILARYHAALDLQAVRRIALASVMGVPVGVWALSQVDETLVRRVLGVLVGGYAIYALLRPHLPALTHPRWADGLGFTAGVLGGAYNMPGPVVVVYGTCRRWPPAVFKSNLQGFFLLNSGLVTAAHLAAGNYTPVVLEGFLAALPAIGLGALAGFALDGYLDPGRFRQLVLILLIVLAATLIT